MVESENHPNINGICGFGLDHIIIEKVLDARNIRSIKLVPNYCDDFDDIQFHSTHNRIIYLFL